ncbi:hypothetical protein [Actinophytocola sp. NPDC049390]|uniref:hypothetical protein n=1 Tax=Actinophytocola sp. NPDC049390 TaxID=3363894 RepID=UPI00379F55B0
MLHKLLTRLNPLSAWRRRVAEDERLIAELQTAVRHDPDAYARFLRYLGSEGETR